MRATLYREREREIEVIEKQRGDLGHEPDWLLCKRGWAWGQKDIGES